MFKNKTLLITGGTGSFGNAVLQRFLDSDIKEIRIFSRDEKKQDDMHPGYINIINKAAEYGDVMVGLFTDKAIANHRRLPYLTWEQRKNVVENIKNVTMVVPQNEWTYISNLKKYKPDFIIHG